MKERVVLPRDGPADTLIVFSAKRKLVPAAFATYNLHVAFASALLHLPATGLVHSAIRAKPRLLPSVPLCKNFWRQMTAARVTPVGCCFRSEAASEWTWAPLQPLPLATLGAAAAQATWGVQPGQEVQPQGMLAASALATSDPRMAATVPGGSLGRNEQNRSLPRNTLASTRDKEMKSSNSRLMSRNSSSACIDNHCISSNSSQICSKNRFHSQSRMGACGIGAN